LLKLATGRAFFAQRADRSAAERRKLYGRRAAGGSYPALERPAVDAAEHNHNALYVAASEIIEKRAELGAELFGF